MKPVFSFLFFGGLLLVQCTDNKTNNPSPPQKGSHDSLSVTRYLHSIELHSVHELAISQAFLTTKNGVLLHPDNTIREGEPVYLNLVIKSGWKATNGSVTLGANQSVTTDKGEPVLQSGDLFAGNPSIPVAEAGRIRLQALITKSRSDIRFFVVRFLLWDKNSNAAAEGSYRLFVTRR
jgi:hypothetical protein